MIENDLPVLFNYLNSISKQTFQELIGSSDDITKPIITDFCVKRYLIVALEIAVVEHKCVVLTGFACSGKTCYLLLLATNKTKEF
ncbi:hypothetical protein HNP72_002069 [Sphingobacterium soli]|uniref:Uncharacterized protein n=1 Tax=Sphingobacterium cellulitidis TaxID=1768011 RepID=A0A8H9FYE7_9SPHI|nr:hypothetical protein [Sphingobacterium soli]GGE14975.1 hypothetical protein GCM10011516_10950 [Sphingobacterium soli]